MNDRALRMKPASAQSIEATSDTSAHAGICAQQEAAAAAVLQQRCACRLCACSPTPPPPSPAHLNDEVDACGRDHDARGDRHVARHLHPRAKEREPLRELRLLAVQGGLSVTREVDAADDEGGGPGNGQAVSWDVVGQGKAGVVHTGARHWRRDLTA
jgi:hypothetical protein